MKRIIYLFVILFLTTNFSKTIAQDTIQKNEDSISKRNYFQVSPRIGYDVPTFKNKTPYIDYKAGSDFGISLDYYWSWFGVGADFDYIKNKPQSTYPTNNFYEPGFASPITSYNLNEEDITRIFYGLGPSFKYNIFKNKLIAELNTRIGFANINGGRTLLEVTAESLKVYPLNFHAGYDEKNVLSAKAQLKLTYFFNKNIGFNLGGYFMQHFGVNELNEKGVSASYYPFSVQTGVTNDPVNLIDREKVLRSTPCDCDIFSIGLFAGFTYKFNIKSNEKKLDEIDEVCPVCQKDHHPYCCVDCKSTVTITAVDKITGKVLPHTDIILRDLDGKIKKSGTTNAYGIIVFEDVSKDNYEVRGKLYGTDLSQDSISNNDFLVAHQNSSSIERTLLYTDESFILKGNVVECDQNKFISDVEIHLQNKLNSEEKFTNSDENGSFNFKLRKASTYTLIGNKDGYYSSQVELKTSRYNRNKTLFIDFEMCVDPCGKAIDLQNINFDLNKSEILAEAIPDLNRVVKLMKDNPTIKVEMSSHTDSQGSDAYNLKLSQRRADATVEYIVSQGISKERLIARGAGETELKNKKCANNVPCTDDEHRINRRTEFKVTCD